MRLLLVIDSFGSGGAQRQLVHLALGLVAAGHTVEFFVYAPEQDHFRGDVAAAGIPVHAFHKRSRYSPAVLGALARVLRTGGFDAAVAYLTTPNVYTEVAARLNRLRGVRTPVVVSERGPLERVGLRLRLMLGAHHLADRVVMNSWNNREQLLSVWPSLRARSSVIYNGIDLHLFAPGQDPPAAVPGRLELLAVGTVLPSKDAMVLVEALARHRERHGWAPSVSWVGKLAPYGGDARYEALLRARIAELALEEHWTFLGERRDVPDLMRRHDALVHPSVLEGLPNAVCEALACGLPVIAARIGDNEALVGHGQSGYLFTPADAGDLAGAIGTFAALPAPERAAMRAAARAFAERSLGLARCVAEYEALLRGLASR